MKITGILFWVVVVAALLLGACAPDPRNQADADATTRLSVENAKDQVQLREQNQIQFDLEQQQRELQSAQWVVSWNQFVRITMFVLNIAVSISITGTSIGLVIALIGTGQAWSIYAKAKAKTAGDLIPLDPKTRQFPLLKWEGKGKYTLTNANDNSVLLLDTNLEADRQKISAMGATQLAGAVAYEARKSRDPSSIAGIEPVVIGYKEKSGMEIGAFIQQAREMLTGGRR